MPRKYELGKRAVQQADTRRRIIAAALELYQERGVSATTMLDVARRADVAPGTVANHFGSAAALATEVTEEILGELRMPAPDLFDGVVGLRDRIDLLVRELSAFFDRSEPWYRASQREVPGVSFWADAEARYYRQLDALVRAALGPLASDADAVAVVVTVFGRWVVGSLQEAGRTSEEAASLVSDLLATWLETRSALDEQRSQRAGHTPGRRARGFRRHRCRGPELGVVVSAAGLRATRALRPSPNSRTSG